MGKDKSMSGWTPQRLDEKAPDDASSSAIRITPPSRQAGCRGTRRAPRLETDMIGQSRFSSGDKKKQ